ncbi:hypothetical protein ABCS02_34325 [Microbacterium sp. X-17]|uniref:hypothetical protein n=1 Tax=Microbacterium sp. X-17 TaxID=3144404 RepID=UPI0031F49CE7
MSPAIDELPPSEANVAPRVSIDENEVTVSLDGAQIGWHLPGDPVAPQDIARIPSARSSESGGPLLSTVDRGATLSSYATDDGAQTLIEIPSASAPHEYRFPLNLPDDTQAALNSDGSVIIVGPTGPVGFYKAPWAVDATGRAVPTDFRIEGNTLIQTVHFDESVAFPVVADPDFGGEWWGWYWQATRAETQQLAAASGDIQSLVGVLSSFCGAIPNPPASVACAIAANGVALSYAWRIRDANANGQCVAFNLPWASIANPLLVQPNLTVVACRR